MKKSITALLAACILLTGCGADDTNTQPEVTTAAISQEAGLPPVDDAVTVEADVPAVPETAESVQETTDATEEAVIITPEDETTEVIPVIDTYVEYIMAYDNTFLGLPQKDKIYIFSNTGKTAEIDGEICYCISCSDEYEGNLYPMCDFYVSEQGDKVYRYYHAEDRYALLPETSSGYTQMDPTTQSPEEIFTVANALYGYFDLCALSGINSVTLEKEVNGSIWTYYLVADERLDTKVEMLNALSCYFSADIINSLMDSQLYAEGDDGKLYSTGGARGSDICYISTEYELSILTADTAEFTAYSTYRVDPDSDAETYTDTITYSVIKRDGRWFFTTFDLPY